MMPSTSSYLSLLVYYCTQQTVVSFSPTSFVRLSGMKAEIHQQHHENLAFVIHASEMKWQLSMSGSDLSERQLQFWEDVESGLDEIEEYYKKKDMSIERIREFGKSARGEIPAPEGLMPGHSPSEENVPGLEARPFWDDIGSDEIRFPWASQLEENFDIIYEEFEQTILGKQKDDGVFSGDSAWQNQIMGEGWSAFRLQRLGVWNVENCKKFPKTYELLQSLSIPFAVRGVCFARQRPQSGVATHSDGRNFILTSHLALEIPEGCWIQVGSDEESNRRSWETGKLLTLDTSFMHSTGNPTDKERHVLIIDFWHPDLTEAEKAALEFIYDLRNKFENGDVPFRTPRSVIEQRKREQEEQGGGLGQLWKSLTGGE